MAKVNHLSPQGKRMIERMEKIQTQQEPSRSPGAELPDKQRRIYEMLIRGYRQNEIGRELSLSSAMTTYYVTKIFEHFHVGSVRKLIAHAVKHRYIMYRNSSFIEITGRVSAN